MSEDDDVNMVDPDEYSASFDGLLTPPRQTDNIVITSDTPVRNIVATPERTRVTNDNQESIHQYISRRLHVFDLTKESNEKLPIDKLEEAEKHKILSIFHDLIKLRERDIEMIDSLSDEMTRIKQDTTHHQNVVSKKNEDEKKLQKKLGRYELEIGRINSDKKKLEKALRQEKGLRIKEEKQHKSIIKKYETNNSKLERENRTLRERVSKLQSGTVSKSREFVLNNVPSQSKTSVHPMRVGKGGSREKMKFSVKNDFEHENKELREELNVVRASISNMIDQVYTLRTIVYRRKGSTSYIPKVTDNLLNRMTDNDDIGSGSTVQLPFKEYSKEYIESTMKKLINEVKEVCEDFDESGDFDVIQKYETISRILIEFVSDDEEKYQEAVEILEGFNSRILYLQDLLQQQNKFLSIEGREKEKRDLFSL